MYLSFKLVVVYVYLFAGPTYVIWFGTTPRVTISDPTMIKEIFFTKSEFFDKTEAPPIITKIEGHGLLNLKGQKWAHRRRLIQPFFHAENLKVLYLIIIYIIHSTFLLIFLHCTIKLRTKFISTKFNY